MFEELHNDNFRIELHGRVAEVIFGPAGGVPVTDAIGHALLANIWPVLDRSDQVSVILVRSEGRAFSAGGAISLVEDMLANGRTRLRVLREARAIVQNMIDCDKPIVSAINGAAVGAGLAVALLADVSIAAENAKLIDGHTKLGVAAGDHAAVIWPLLCGIAKAKYYLLTCDAVTGAEAERIGLVSLVAPDDQLLARAREVADRLAQGSPTALAFTKRTINHWLRMGLPAFEHSLAAEMYGFTQADAHEGLEALKEKRAPKFSL
jgi:enoyl-CoA hydratase